MLHILYKHIFKINNTKSNKGLCVDVLTIQNETEMYAAPRITRVLTKLLNHSYNEQKLVSLIFMSPNKMYVSLLKRERSAVN